MEPASLVRGRRASRRAPRRVPCRVPRRVPWFRPAAAGLLFRLAARVLPRVLPHALLAAGLLAAGMQAAGALQRGPAKPLGAEPWLVTAGTRGAVEGVVQCVPAEREPRGSPMPASEPAGAALRADAQGYCESVIRFSYEALWYLSVVSASIDGAPCTSTRWFVACPVLLTANASATVSTLLDADPYARGSTEVAVSGIENPVYQPLDFQTEGGITVDQAPALVVPGVNRSGTTQLTVRASGPSGARGVQIKEQMPAFISVHSDDPACHFESLPGLLSCAWPHLDPGATIRVPIQISAGAGFPTSQLTTRLEAGADLGQAGAAATIVVSGNLVVGEQSLDAPARVLMDSSLVDKVSLHTLPSDARATLPPGIPARWTVHFSPGLQVQSVTPAEDSRDLVCTYSDDSVSCNAPNYGSEQPGTNANASIRLGAVQTGEQTATLHWDSTQGVGTTSQRVQVLWDAAEADGGKAAPAASSPTQGEAR